MSFRKTSENDELTNVENTSRSKIFLQARTSDEYVNNLFYWSLRVSLRLACSMNLRKFPMDVQICNMQIQSCKYQIFCVKLYKNLIFNLKQKCIFFSFFFSRLPNTPTPIPLVRHQHRRTTPRTRTPPIRTPRLQKIRMPLELHHERQVFLHPMQLHPKPINGILPRPIIYSNLSNSNPLLDELLDQHRSSPSPNFFRSNNSTNDHHPNFFFPIKFTKGFLY